jgi:hypothetical protein
VGAGVNWPNVIWCWSSLAIGLVGLFSGRPEIATVGFVAYAAFGVLAVAPQPRDYETIQRYAAMRDYKLLGMRWQLFCLSGGWELGGKPRRTYFVKLVEPDGRRRDMVVAFTPWLRKRDFIVLEDSGGLV